MHIMKKSYGIMVNRFSGFFTAFYIIMILYNLHDLPIIQVYKTTVFRKSIDRCRKCIYYNFDSIRIYYIICSCLFSLFPQCHKL